MYVVIDIRNYSILWNGSKKDCKKYLSMTNPRNRRFYLLAKVNKEKGEIKIL